MYGLQKMHCQYPQVLALIDALAEKIKKTCNVSLNAQAIGNAVYGLQNMDYQYPAVCALVEALAEKIRKTCNVSLSAQDIGSAVYGLQNMDCQYPEVRALVDALAEKIQQSQQVTLKAQQIGMALYGLKNMRYWGQKNNLFVAIVKKAQKSLDNNIFTEKESAVDLIFYVIGFCGLVNIQAKNNEIDSLKGSLLQKIGYLSAFFNTHDVPTALKTIKKMQVPLCLLHQLQSVPEWQQFISQLPEKNQLVLQVLFSYFKPKQFHNETRGLFFARDANVSAGPMQEHSTFQSS